MKKLILLAAFAFLSCTTNDKEVESQSTSNEKFNYTFNQKNYNFANDKCFYGYYNNEYSIQLFSNNNRQDGYWILLEGNPFLKPYSVNINYREFGKFISLTKYEFTITKDDGTYISGTFKSDFLSGKFENIKREYY